MGERGEGGEKDGKGKRKGGKEGGRRGGRRRQEGGEVGIGRNLLKTVLIRVQRSKQQEASESPAKERKDQSVNTLHRRIIRQSSRRTKRDEP